MNEARAEAERIAEGRTVVAMIGVPPVYGTPGSAACDLVTTEDKLLEPGERWLAPNGIKMAIPKGHFGMVCPRSGLAIKHGITVLNGPGIIDSDYRGDFFVPLINLGQVPVQFEAGDRIAQLVIVPFVSAYFLTVEKLDETERGSGGFGSTDKKD